MGHFKLIFSGPYLQTNYSPTLLCEKLKGLGCDFANKFFHFKVIFIFSRLEVDLECMQKLSPYVRVRLPPPPPCHNTIHVHFILSHMF